MRQPSAAMPRRVRTDMLKTDIPTRIMLTPIIPDMPLRRLTGIVSAALAGEAIMAAAITA